MHPIDVVATNHIEHDGLRIVTGCFFTGVEPQKRAVGAHQFRPCLADMPRGYRGFGRGIPCAERIEPGVKFESAPMRLGYREFQGIIVGLGRLAHLSSEIFRPGFNL